LSRSISLAESGSKMSTNERSRILSSEANINFPYPFP
jgi:hypothetical protein